MKDKKEFLKRKLDEFMLVDYKIKHYKKTGYFRVYLKGQVSFIDKWIGVGIIEDESVLHEKYLKEFIGQILYTIKVNPYIKKPKIKKEY